jgi:hypothetical protein
MYLLGYRVKRNCIELQSETPKEEIGVTRIIRVAPIFFFIQLVLIAVIEHTTGRTMTWVAQRIVPAMHLVPNCGLRGNKMGMKNGLLLLSAKSNSHR